jgi:hypothetical protein
MLGNQSLYNGSKKSKSINNMDKNFEIIRNTPITLTQLGFTCSKKVLISKN